ncbi:DUF488 domain-containing protein [Nitrospira lenta]|uniref:Uroporphyrin-III C-methyltransferase n=1 Tax=Nitrospira lenta TaxID=1436998 RepID=A0A330LBW5_9BACT|nr:DUF488 domain-containing protein [Nitrospira lenta]SPP66419.1 conserved hypothetical protein [Nitrospira lenta]
MASTLVRIKRIYAPVAEGDGYRILVDRLWPRGVSKVAARIDLWMRDIAPSTALRQWFNHDPAKWEEFCERYRTELREQQPLLDTVRQQAKEGPVTLVYSARDERFNQAVVLQLVLKQSTTGKRRAT